MKFSIIIPAKNELHNLQRTMGQYHAIGKEFTHEVIIADGASTDGSIEYGQQHADRVEVKTKQERETIGEGRNRGAKVANGDILIFIDAGVVIQDIVRFFETVQKAFEDKNIVAAVPRVLIDPKEATYADNLVHGFVNGLIAFCNAIGWGAGKGETQIIRRSAFEKLGGYNEKLVAAEDNDMMRRLARIGKTVSLKELHVYDDPARYRKLGYPRVIGQWLLNQFFVIFLGRSYSKEWKRAD